MTTPLSPNRIYKFFFFFFDSKSCPQTSSDHNRDSDISNCLNKSQCLDRSCFGSRLECTDKDIGTRKILRSRRVCFAPLLRSRQSFSYEL